MVFARMDINVRLHNWHAFVLRVGLYSMRPQRHGFLGEVEKCCGDFPSASHDSPRGTHTTHSKCVIGLVDLQSNPFKTASPLMG